MIRTRWLQWIDTHARSISASVLGLVAIAYLGFVYYFGVNVPFQDEWAVVILYRSAVHGRLSLAQLWTQHNENRMLFPNLLMLGLDHLSHFDTKVEMYASVLMLIVAVTLIAVVYRRTTSSSPMWFVPAGLVLFGWTQYAVALQGFAIALYLILLCLSVALVALAASRSRPALFLVAIFAATVASYSSTQGLAIWAAGLVFLLARGYPRSRCWWWLASAACISGIYWIGFIWSDTGGGVRWALANPAPTLHYFYLLVGSVIPTSHALGIGASAQAAVGAVLLLLSLGTVGYWLWRRNTGEWLAVPLALIAFGILIDFLITIGRAHLGLQTATSSRYTLFNLWLFAGVWLAGAAVVSRSHLPGARVVVVLLACLTLVQVLGSFHSGLVEGRITRSQREQAVALVHNYATAPENQVVPLVYQLYPGFKPLAAFLAHEHLSVFYRANP